MVKAFVIALRAHYKQKDKSGKPYIFHPLHVAFRVSGKKQKQVALLHDVVEDSPISLDVLKKKGFCSEVINAVDAITKREHENYDEYLLRVKSNELARAVKIADLLHNSDLSRLKTITAKDIARVMKYMSALKYLN